MCTVEHSNRTHSKIFLEFLLLLMCIHRQIHLTKILQWYRVDFGGSSEEVSQCVQSGLPVSCVFTVERLFGFKKQ